MLTRIFHKPYRVERAQLNRRAAPAARCRPSDSREMHV